MSRARVGITALWPAEQTPALVAHTVEQLHDPQQRQFVGRHRQLESTVLPPGGPEDTGARQFMEDLAQVVPGNVDRLREVVGAGVLAIPGFPCQADDRAQGVFSRPGEQGSPESRR
jgi:hypothetical protein